MRFGSNRASIISRSSVREDRAEFFTAVMLSPETFEFAIQAADEDEFVNNKLILLAEILTLIVDNNAETEK